MADYEKLGVFYLGKERDLTSGEAKPDLLLYDSRDLTTHGVIVGMTGSGKTGLAISLLEEALIDGVPAIAIDPKGDLCNLLLTFPDLKPEDFRPWVDDGEAQRKGVTTEQLSEQVAETWRKGLADWDQDAARIGRLREAADFAIYTPGSSAGIPLSVLKSLTAPSPALLDDKDALRERVSSSVSGLLALIGVEADPVQSREHILLSNLVDRAWSEGRDLDIATLIREIQSPPMDRIGVLDIDSFFPEKERAALSISLNNLLASPAFAAWMEGETLDIQRLLWTPEGKPRLSIISIAHLSDAERMFIVTIVLNEMVAWMRAQTGTSSLRALLYMDEVFGYFPPVANPPSKMPMLTLFKQARAFGLGVVVATQNPVDLDYKGLANAGTWFLGRLQTERDKARVMEGLEGAAAAAGKAFDQAKYDELLARLGNRVFLMNNVHDDVPVLFQTRWALSYLRGPLTKPQIQSLMAGRKAQASPASSPEQAPVTVPAAMKPSTTTIAASIRPMVPSDVPESFLAWRGSAEGSEQLTYRPRLLASARLHYVEAKSDVDVWEGCSLLCDLPDSDAEPAWEHAQILNADQIEVETSPSAGAAFDPLPSAAARAKSYTRWDNTLEDYLYRVSELSIPTCPTLDLTAAAGESEGDFRVRVQQAMREKRDAAIDDLRAKYSPKLEALQAREQRALERVQREQAQYSQRQFQAVISVGVSVLNAVFGRSRRSSISTTAINRAGQAWGQHGDVQDAEETVDTIRQKQIELHTELETEVSRLTEQHSPDAITLETRTIHPRKSDITVERFSLAWTPYWVSNNGQARAAFGS